MDKPTDSGQHTIEFTMLLILIMVGIIMGGPYVIRSWNAHIKGLEDSVVDSINDPLMSAPTQGISPPFCNCGGFENVGCGPITTNIFGGSLTCNETEMLSRRPCSPLDCELSDGSQGVTAMCNIDASCCTAWVNDNLCGANAFGGPLVGGACPDGTMQQSRLCGTITGYQCVTDLACVFNCIGSAPVGAAYLGVCGGSTTGLYVDTPYTYSDVCSGAKCEIQCNNAADYYATTGAPTPQVWGWHYSNCAVNGSCGSCTYFETCPPCTAARNGLRCAVSIASSPNDIVYQCSFGAASNCSPSTPPTITNCSTSATVQNCN